MTAFFGSDLRLKKAVLQLMMRHFSSFRWSLGRLVVMGAEITFQTSLDDEVVLGPNNPMVMKQVAGRGDAVPLCRDQGWIDGQIVTTGLLRACRARHGGPDGKLGVWSGSHFFAMED